jgi:AraC family transcriptional regulator
MTQLIEPRANLPVERHLAGNADWHVTEYICRAGPEDRAFEERHHGFSISVVLEGTFTYRTGKERALLHPGAFLFGNHGSCFECGHDHSRGDRCIAFHFEPEFFAEIAASAGCGARYTFKTAMLPVAKAVTPVVSQIEALAIGPQVARIEDVVVELAETVIGHTSGHKISSPTVSTREERRLADVLQHIETHASELIDLAALAAIAGVSRYHFLRIFRRVTGMTPYQYLLSVRMRRAALRLATTTEPVSAIAFDAGFGDLSTFNKQFRSVFGATPSAYRGRS